MSIVPRYYYTRCRACGRRFAVPEGSGRPACCSPDCHARWVAEVQRLARQGLAGRGPEDDAVRPDVVAHPAPEGRDHA